MSAINRRRTTPTRARNTRASLDWGSRGIARIYIIGGLPRPLFPSMHIQRFVALVAIASLIAPAVLSAQARSAPVFVNGMAQVVPAFADSAQWIRQNLWVETDFDSDGDGRKDRVHVAVTRPRQTETGGLKVPVVYGSSPYYAGIARAFEFWNVRQELGEPSPPRNPMLPPPHDPARTRISNQLVRTWV